MPLKRTIYAGGVNEYADPPEFTLAEIEVDVRLKTVLFPRSHDARWVWGYRTTMDIDKVCFTPEEALTAFERKLARDRIFVESKLATIVEAEAAYLAWKETHD